MAESNPFLQLVGSDENYKKLQQFFQEEMEHEDISQGEDILNSSTSLQPSHSKEDLPVKKKRILDVYQVSRALETIFLVSLTNGKLSAG